MGAILLLVLLPLHIFLLGCGVISRDLPDKTERICATQIQCSPDFLHTDGKDHHQGAKSHLGGQVSADLLFGKTRENPSATNFPLPLLLSITTFPLLLLLLLLLLFWTFLLWSALLH